jgi:hypothetical protein
LKVGILNLKAHALTKYKSDLILKNIILIPEQFCISDWIFKT